MPFLRKSAGSIRRGRLLRIDARVFCNWKWSFLIEFYVFVLKNNVWCFRPFMIGVQSLCLLGYYIKNFYCWLWYSPSLLRFMRYEEIFVGLVWVVRYFIVITVNAFYKFVASGIFMMKTATWKYQDDSFLCVILLLFSSFMLSKSDLADFPRTKPIFHRATIWYYWLSTFSTIRTYKLVL